jgi:molybdate transport system ATP-binding protein
MRGSRRLPLTKEEILPYFETLHASLSIPVLYVSHDISEIERLAESGRVVAPGPLNQLFADTRLPIAKSPQHRPFWKPASVATVRMTPSAGATAGAAEGGNHGGTERVRIGTTDVSLSVDRPSQTTILNIVPVRVKDAEPLDETQVNVLLTIGHCDGGAKLLARITRRAHRLLRLGPRQDLYAQIKAVSLIGSSDRWSR